MHLDALAKHCSAAIQTELSRFGLELVNFYFHSINIPDEDPSYQRLKVIKEKAAELNVLGRDIYQYDRSMEVLKTAAANEGGGAGLMQAGVGLAVGAGLGQQMMQQTSVLSTQLPSALQYHVAAAGKATGPFNGAQLQQMQVAGAFNADSLVWRQGMAGWQAASTVPELAVLFTPPTPPLVPMPPPIPPTT